MVTFDLSHTHVRQGNVVTSQATETHRSTTRGGSKPFAHTVHSVRHDNDGDFSLKFGLEPLRNPKTLLVGKFTLYFPYILLIAALVLTGIERFFNKIFKSNIQVPIPCILT